MYIFFWSLSALVTISLSYLDCTMHSFYPHWHMGLKQMHQYLTQTWIALTLCKGDVFTLELSTNSRISIQFPLTEISVCSTSASSTPSTHFTASFHQELIMQVPSWEIVIRRQLQVVLTAFSPTDAWECTFCKCVVCLCILDIFSRIIKCLFVCLFALHSIIHTIVKHVPPLFGVDVEMTCSLRSLHLTFYACDLWQ